MTDKYRLLGQGTTDRYQLLKKTLDRALEQAARGKGAERHGNDKGWEDQPIHAITAVTGPGFPVGQALKKTTEAMGMLSRGDRQAAVREFLGAIVYLCAAIEHVEALDKLDDKRRTDYDHD